MEKPDKERLDVLVASKLGLSRTMALDLIKEGKVKVSGKTIKTPGLKFSPDCLIEAEEKEYTFVGRGGYKLLAAVKKFNICLLGKTCADIGASTGGFTDCMIKEGAKLVYAVDTGTDQLAESLKNNSSVISMEKTDIRDAAFNENMDFASVDVSFISLEKILYNVFLVLKEEGEAVCLIKPQFEAGRAHIGRKGIVKDKKIHLRVLKKIYDLCCDCKFRVMDIMPSPISGGDGNKEYLIYLYKGNAKYGLGVKDYLLQCEEIIKSIG